MECRFCENKSEYVCDCSITFCHSHIPAHNEECQNLKISMISEHDKVRIFSMTLSQRIRKINQICCEVVQNTQKLISTIEKLCKNRVNDLKKLKSRYYSIIERGKLKELENLNTFTNSTVSIKSTNSKSNKLCRSRQNVIG